MVPGARMPHFFLFTPSLLLTHTSQGLGSAVLPGTIDDTPGALGCCRLHTEGAMHDSQEQNTDGGIEKGAVTNMTRLAAFLNC